MKNIILIAIITAAAASLLFPRELISPVLIVFAGLLIGISLISFTGNVNKDFHFLLTLFMLAFLSRVVSAAFLYNFTYIKNGIGLLWDGVGFSINGSMILDMWVGGIRDIDQITINMMKGNAAGNLGAYDFWNAMVYYFTGKSPLCLLFINSLASSLTVIFIYKIAKKLHNVRTAVFASVLTAFWPSIFFWSIQNLKESITIFLLSLLIWNIVCLKKHFRFYLIFLIAGASILLKVFRGVFFYILYLAVIPFSVLLSLLKMRRFRGILWLFFASGFLFSGYFMNLIRLITSYSLENTSVLDWLQQIRMDRALGASSAFLSGWDITNPFTLSLFIPVALLIAWLAPFPWQLGSIIQIASMPEMLLYYLLLPSMFAGAKFIIKHRLKEGGIILAYISIVILMLAFLEGNIGTLFRHRAMVLPMYFVLVAIGLDRYRFKIRAYV